MLLMYGVNSHIDHIFSIFKLFLFQIQNKCLQLNFRILTKYILNECLGDELKSYIVIYAWNIDYRDDDALGG
jgi:hypothetical protein